MTPAFWSGKKVFVTGHTGFKGGWLSLWLQSLGAEVVGLSVQSTAYQQEMADRLHLPFPVVSDADYQFQGALQLPTFIAAGMTLLKRITLIANDGVIEAIHYPIFPSDSDPAWVINYLKNTPA